jgi:methylated-DNA-[protein]-cysteine S-methyltransferase
MLLRSSLKTPIGALSLISRDQILLAAGFQSHEKLQSGLSHADKESDYKKVSLIPVISELLSDYFDGDLSAIEGISVDQPGEKFSQLAWKGMRRVTPGKVISYADLARKAGSPDAVRAAGSACARNLIAVVVPCHRIVKTGGALGNYAYGLKYKEWLLRHEGALK